MQGDRSWNVAQQRATMSLPSLVALQHLEEIEAFQTARQDVRRMAAAAELPTRPAGYQRRVAQLRRVVEGRAAR